MSSAGTTTEMRVSIFDTIASRGPFRHSSLPVERVLTLLSLVDAPVSPHQEVGVVVIE
jgi:hypothetical protein